MRTMFVKLFFWFWLATVLSGGICFLLAINVRLSPDHERYLRHEKDGVRRFLDQTVATYGANAAALYERGTLATVSPGEGSLKGYLFAATGAPISAQAPERIRLAVADAVKGEGPRQPGAPGDVVVVPVQGPSGGRYFAASDGFPRPPRPPMPFGRFPFPPNFWMNSAITFLISGLVCYGLAWRLATPIRRLRAATQSLAEGELTARVELAPKGGRDELADLGRDFNRMAGRIENLVTSHRQLVRDVSHELRSPLARLGVALELARKATGPAVDKSLDRIGVEAWRLNELIGELLALSRLEGCGETVPMERFDLAELVGEVVSDADYEARDGNRRVVAVCPASAPIFGNRELMRRALENVVRNGARYTAKDSAVEVSLEQGEDFLEIRVRDHGPGVPEGELVAIFRPFYRVAEARDRESGGTGIGLAISQGTVALHGGSISALNVPGGGLQVAMRIPCR